MNIFEVIDKKSLEKRDIKEDFETFLNKILAEKNHRFKYYNPRNLYRAVDMLNLQRLDVMKDYLTTYPNVTNEDFEKMLSVKSLKEYKKLFDSYKKDFVKDLRERELNYIFDAIDADISAER